MQIEIETIRDLAETQDRKILELLAERAKFSQLTREIPKDSCAQTYVQNSWYQKLLSHLCSKKSTRIATPKLERELAHAIMHRTVQVGERVARYKHPRGLPVYIPEVEKRKIRERIQEVQEQGIELTPYKIAYSYLRIFRETKRIEELVKSNVSGSGIRTIQTDSKDVVENIKGQLEYEASRLPGNHSVGVSETQVQGLPRYHITLF